MHSHNTETISWKKDSGYIILNARMSIYCNLLKSSIQFICLFFWALLLNYCLLTLDLFRAHRTANRNLKLVLDIFLSKWMVANTVIEVSISLHKYAVSETNENVDNKCPH